jgi:hypothetical protein
MNNQLILNQAKQLDAIKFVEFLEENKIDYSVLDCNLMDYNDDYFNIEFTGDDGLECFLFLDGKFQD